MNPGGKLAFLSASLCLSLLSACLVEARTWRVEKDGSGDYTAIQPAVNGAAAGDTILIGPGRYTETTLFDPDWGKELFPKPVLIAVTVDDLTILGASAEQVTLAPDAPDSTPDGPMGIVTDLWISNLYVAGLTVEGVFDGMYLYGFAEVLDSTFRNSNKGIAYWDEDGMIVRRCGFESNYCGVSPMTAGNVIVDSCSFSNNTKAVLNIGSLNVAVLNSEFHGNRTAIDYQQGASGSVHGCSTESVLAGINLVTNSSLYLVGNEITGGSCCLLAMTNCQVTGIDNVFSGGEDATIGLSKSTAELHGNHILRSSGYSVWLGYYLNTPAVTLDMTDNYWGTTDVDQIAEWIWDGNDDPSIQAFVQYEPFASAPIGTEQQSWGRVKALYR